MHGQQAQAFGAQQAYSQQISSRMPSPYPGLGATGMGGGFGSYSGYNYGNNNSYGPGNSFGNTMTSAIGGIGNAIGGGMGIAGAVGGFMMGGPIGALAGYAGGSIIGGGIKHVANSFMAGAHEQASLERTLSQFQHHNPSASGGRGFSRGDSMQIGNMVRQMERMPEMLTSFGELNRLMDKMGQMGLMQGVRDAGEFMRKFRDTTHTLRDMAKMMGSTMEGALKAFGEARQSGFYSNADITKNVLQRQIVGGVSGMNQAQIAGLQQYGGEMAHSLGGSRRGGASNMLRTAGQLGMANQMGILSNDAIMEMTGKEGAAGIEDLSATMGQLSYRMGRSNVGQALTLALGAQKDGRYTGEMDQELVEKVRRGEISLTELKSLARSKASTRGAKLSFAAHKDRLRTNMAGAVGSEGIAMQLQEILGNRGWNNPDATNLVMQRFGASEEQANLLQKLMPNLQDIGAQMGMAGKTTLRNNAINSRMAETGFDAVKHRISKKLQHYTTDWAKDLGVSVRDYFQNWADDFMDDLSGRYTKEVTKRISSIAQFGNLGKMSAGIDTTLKGVGGARLDVGQSGGLSGLAARGMHWLGGSETAGERMDYIMAKHMGGRYLHHGGSGGLTGLAGKMAGSGMMGIGGMLLDKAVGGDAAQQAAKAGKIVLDSSFTGRASFTTEAEMKQLKADVLSGDYGKNQLAQLKGVISEDELKGLVGSYENIMKSGGASQIDDPVERERYIYEQLRKDNRKGLTDMEAQYERMGAITKTALGKARQKGKLGEGDIVQAIATASGKKFRGGVDLKSMMGGLESMSGAAIAKAMSQASDKMKKITGDDTMMGGHELKAILDEGGDMGRLAMHLAASNDIAGGMGDMAGFLTGNKVKEILSLDPSEWKKNGYDEVLKNAGIDPVKMAQRMKDNPKEVDRLLKLAASGKIDANEIKNYMALADAAGSKEIFSRVSSKGEAMKATLSGESGNYAKSVLGKTKEGKKVLDLLKKRADTLAGVQTGKDYEDAMAGTGELEDALGALTEDQKKAAFAIDDTLSSSASYRKKLTSKKGGLKGGDDVQKILDKAGFGKIGMTGAEGEFRSRIEKMISGGKTAGLDADEMKNVVNLLQTTNQKGLFSKAGSEAASTQVSEADIAKSLATMSDNAKATAELLKTLADKDKK